MTAGVSYLHRSNAEMSDLVLRAEVSVALQLKEPVPSGAAGYLCVGGIDKRGSLRSSWDYWT